MEKHFELQELVRASTLYISENKGLIEQKNETNPENLALSRVVHPTRFELISSVPETEILSIELWVLGAASGR